MNCIFDVWTCIFVVWTCIWDVWTCFFVSGHVLGVSGQNLTEAEASSKCCALARRPRHKEGTWPIARIHLELHAGPIGNKSIYAHICVYMAIYGHTYGYICLYIVF